MDRRARRLGLALTPLDRLAIVGRHGIGALTYEPAVKLAGGKDTILLDGPAELLMQFTQPATPRTPFMFHCHILEHEDAGMMGQYATT